MVPRYIEKAVDRDQHGGDEAGTAQRTIPAVQDATHRLADCQQYEGCQGEGGG